MNNKTFADIWFSLGPDQKKALAERAGTSVDHLRQVAGGHRNIGVDLGARLKRADRRMTDAVLWPKLYGRTT